MIARVYRSYLLDTVREQFVDIDISAVASVASNQLYEFILKYKDVDPKLIIQFLAAEDVESTILTPVSLERVTGSSDFGFYCSLGYTTTLVGQINSMTDKVISSIDTRLNNKSSLSIDQEPMNILSVTHDHILGQSFLKVSRQEAYRTSHYIGSSIKVIRTHPSVSIFNRALGMIKITWLPTDTDSPGNYDIELLITCGSGDAYVKWTVLPQYFKIRIDPDYDLR